MANTFISVETLTSLSESGLATLQRRTPYIKNANHKYDGIERLPGNRGATARVKVPSRFSAASSLSAFSNIQPIYEEYRPITVDQKKIVPVEASAEQIMFFLQNEGEDGFMENYGVSMYGAIGEVAAQYAADLVSTSARYAVGDGRTAINSIVQLRQIFNQFNAIGSVGGSMEFILPAATLDTIVNNQQAKFTPTRNDGMVSTWEIGFVDKINLNKSDVYAKHIAGNIGINNNTLTVASVTKNATGQITSITFTYTGSADANAVKAGDWIRFPLNATNANLQWLTFTGFQLSGTYVMVRATADAASTGTGTATVVVPVNPVLYYDSTGTNPLRTINVDIAAGFQATIANSHKVGVMYDKRAYYFAMPPMPDTTPYTCGTVMNNPSGMSMQTYYGFVPSTPGGDSSWIFACNQMYGALFVDYYTTAILIPLDNDTTV